MILMIFVFLVFMVDVDSYNLTFGASADACRLFGQSKINKTDVSGAFPFELKSVKYTIC